MRILLNGVAVEELSNIIHVTKAQTIGRRMVHKLKEMIPRQMIQIAVQAVVNGKVMARETIKAYRKDVTAKLVNVLLYFLLNGKLIIKIAVWGRCDKKNETIGSTG